MRVAGQDDVDGRVLQRLGDGDDGSLPGDGRHCHRPRYDPAAVPSWIRTICDVDALLAQLLRFSPDGLGFVQERQPGSGAGADQLGRGLQVDADHADRDAVTSKTCVPCTQSGFKPVAVSTMLAPRKGKLARAWWRSRRATP